MNNLRKIRRSMDLTQYEVCKKARLAQSELSLIERGFIMPGEQKKIRISRVLGYPPEEVFPEDMER